MYKRENGGQLNRHTCIDPMDTVVEPWQPKAQ